MNEFTTTIGTSRSTVNRLYKKYHTLKQERKKKGRNMLIPETHFKYFSLDGMIENEDRLKKKIQQMENLLSCLRRGDDMQNFFMGNGMGFIWYNFVSEFDGGIILL